jgi:hypothetical protein
VCEPRVLGPARRHIAVAVRRLVRRQPRELRFPILLEFAWAAEATPSGTPSALRRRRLLLAAARDAEAVGARRGRLVAALALGVPRLLDDPPKLRRPRSGPGRNRSSQPGGSSG